MYSWFIFALWVLLLGFWLLAALSRKRPARRRDWTREALVRLVVLAIVLMALRFPAVTHALRGARTHVNGDPRLGVLGVVLGALGVGVAIWARIVLGSNWGMPMSQKEEPELVTGGPYAFVRHPIYAGFLLLLLGAAIAVSPIWLVPFVLLAAYFAYCAWREERFMAEQLPDRYPAYRKRTKMLIPFVLSAAVLVSFVPAPVRAQSTGAGSTLRGRITAIHGKFDLTVRDDQGTGHSVRMHQGTIIKPTDTTLQSGMDVTIKGAQRGVVFAADEIDTPYLIAPGYAYPVRPPFLFNARYRYDNRH